MDAIVAIMAIMRNGYIQTVCNCGNYDNYGHDLIRYCHGCNYGNYGNYDNDGNDDNFWNDDNGCNREYL